MYELDIEKLFGESLQNMKYHMELAFLPFGGKIKY